MITTLKIQGLAIIESLHIDFSTGFNVITGETGAGKSILIRALNFLIGTKTSSEAVRKGSETATVIGEFILPENHQAVKILEELSIPFDIEAGKASVLIRRVLSVTGRSSAWINDTAVSNQGLREVGATLVDVFGQHENQKLLNPKWHLKYIDTFLADKEIKESYQSVFKEAQSKVVAIRETVEGFLKHQHDQDYIQFRLEELKEFDPSLEDYTTTLNLSKTAGSQTKTKEIFGRAVQCLETEESDSVGKRLWELGKVLSHPQLQESHPEMAALVANIEELAEKVDGLNFTVTKLLSSVDIDEESLEAAEKRVFGYQSLFRKHQVKDADALLAEMQRLETLSSSLDAISGALSQDLQSLESLVSNLKTLALGLSKARMKAALFIKKSVEKELAELSMTGATFDTKWQPVAKDLKEIAFESLNKELIPLWKKSQADLSALSNEGAEEGEFLLASNPGEATLPLARIASGGELSRIMLALKKAIATDAQTCVLVFDEIDTGISGRIADVVGQKMQELANGFQVICISHLPQVAVYADAHFLVKKIGKGDKEHQRTESTIVRMSVEESAKEIARLLSGENLSKTSLANAKHLMEMAKERKGKTVKPKNTKAPLKQTKSKDSSIHS